MKTLPTWKIAYTITECEHEYGDYLLHQAAEMTPAAAAAAVAAFWYGDGDPEDEEAFAQALLEERLALLPGDERAVSHLGWGGSPPSSSPSGTVSWKL